MAEEFAPGVKQLELGPVKLYFGADKLVIIDRRSATGSHVTIHLGGATGLVDVHITEPTSGQRSSVVGIAQSDLDLLLRSVEPRAEEYVLRLMKKHLRPVRFGWLEHHDILTYPRTLFDPGGFERLGVRHGKRWVLIAERLREFFCRPLRRSDLEAHPDGAFVLYHRRRRWSNPYGMLLKFTDKHGHIRFLWFRFSKLMADIEELWRINAPHVRTLLKQPVQIEAAIRQVLANQGFETVGANGQRNTRADRNLQ